MWKGATEGEGRSHRGRREEPQREKGGAPQAAAKTREFWKAGLRPLRIRPSIWCLTFIFLSNSWLPYQANIILLKVRLSG